MAEKQFYAYIYLDPRNDEPIYVGKGFGWRFKRHLSRYAYNLHLRNRVTAIRRDGLEPLIGVFPTADEAQAFELEKTLVAAFGRRDKGTGTLCNYTDGGDGESGRYGFKHTEETKARIRKKMQERVLTEEHKLNIGKANKGRPPTFTEASLAKMAAARKTPEYRKRMSDLGKRVMTPEHYEKMIAAQRNKRSGNVAD